MIRNKIIGFLKVHPIILEELYSLFRFILNFIGIFIPTKKKIIFSSVGGRKFDDSPRAIYEEIIEREAFKDWDIVWAFVDTNKYIIPRGRKVKIDTPKFFWELMTSKIWVGNSGIDRGIGLKKKGVIRVETWHGTPVKKICGEENMSNMPDLTPKKMDKDTIRCAQCEYEKEIFKRVFNASDEAVMLCGMPRNDKLLSYNCGDVERIRKEIGIPEGKKVLFYTPTYREYLLDENNLTYLKPPINLARWEQEIGNEYVLLIRAHYAIVNSLGICNSEFVRDVSDYPDINDLYAISDLMISDYSGTIVDFSILDRPILCFAYDYDEYSQKRGLYLDLKRDLPCEVDETEEELLKHIKELDCKKAIASTREFHKKYASIVGCASRSIVNELEKRIKDKENEQ